MTIESATYIGDLNPAYPLDNDPAFPESEGAGIFRLVKTVLQAQFPSLGSSAVTATAAQINSLAASGGLYSVGTSTTSLTIGTGSKSLTTQAGLGFAIGQMVLVTDSANVANYMIGQITAWTSATGAMTFSVASGSTGGSGTKTAWSITVVPASGPFFDSLALLKNSSDASKQAIFSASGITTATTRTFTLPDASGTMGLAPGNNVVSLHTGNGFGGTSTFIRRYTTTLTNTGTAITYADSATLGATFTINETGLYDIYTSDVGSVAGDFATAGASVNSNQLTTALNLITASNRLMQASAGPVNEFASISIVARLVAGDVVRSHAGPSSSNAATTSSVFIIRKVGV